MREIKFRAWSVEKKNMLNNAQFLYDGMCGDEEDVKDPFLYSDNFGNLTEDDEVILMQFTGLKDKNGKEIYEGDWIKDETFFNHAGQEGVEDNILDGVCEYEGASFCVDNGITGCGYVPLNATENWVIVSNVHENPELLEGGKDE